jgi:Mn-dependent DtxR family transcriptional regulator
MKAKTPDEKLMLQFYQMAEQKGDLLCVLSVKLAAEKVGLKETATKNIIKLLAQANFVIKIDETRIHLTEHGCRFVQEELDS